MSQGPNFDPPEQDLPFEPTEGSFPGQFSWDDAYKVAIHALIVATSAVITYIVGEVIPSIHTDNLLVMTALPIVSSLLVGLQRWLSDTRPLEERRILPYKEYRRLQALKKQS